MQKKFSVPEKPVIVVVTSKLDSLATERLNLFFTLYISSLNLMFETISRHSTVLLLIDLDYCSAIRNELHRIVKEIRSDTLKSVIFYSGLKIKLVLNPHNGSIMKPILVTLSDPGIIPEFLSILDTDPLEKFHKDLDISYRSLSPSVRLIIDQCSANYCQIASLSDVYKSTHHPVSDMQKCFQDETGMTLNEYIRRLKVEMSSALLINTDLSAAEIAATVGYATYAQYLRDFKEFQGFTPTEFRKLCPERNLMHTRENC